MPLRDHFRRPASKVASWESVHGMLPGEIVHELRRVLPKPYRAHPRVRVGPYYEVDIGAFEPAISHDGQEPETSDADGNEQQFEAWPDATLTAEVELPDDYAYEVLIYDFKMERELVAMIEIVSPSNKDRSKSQAAIVSKCCTLIAKGVCVSIVDFVTVRRANLYHDVLQTMDLQDPSFQTQVPSIYASTLRRRTDRRRMSLEAWATPLTVGDVLPMVPIWLNGTLKVDLNLENAYQNTCAALGYE